MHRSALLNEKTMPVLYCQLQEESPSTCSFRRYCVGVTIIELDCCYCCVLNTQRYRRLCCDSLIGTSSHIMLMELIFLCVKGTDMHTALIFNQFILLKRFFYKHILFPISQLSPLRKGRALFFLLNLKPLHPGMLCAKFC